MATFWALWSREEEEGDQRGAGRGRGAGVMRAEGGMRGAGVMRGLGALTLTDGPRSSQLPAPAGQPGQKASLCTNRKGAAAKIA